MRSSVRWLFTGLVTLHGLIHLFGGVEGFGFADVEQLTQPVAPGVAVLWLIAAVAVLASVPFTILRSRAWWWLTAAAALVSQIAILTSWGDAKAGTAANVIMVLAAGYGYRTNGRRQQ